MTNEDITAKPKNDETFDKWVDETEFSDAAKNGVPVAGRRGRKKIGTKITVTLPDKLLIEVKAIADKKAIGYQTLIRMIVAENLKKYSESK